MSTLTTEGFPSVMVPVLSKASMSDFAMVSRSAASLNNIPLFAAIEIPTSVAIGVASPKAHGQAITMTEIPTISACSKLSTQKYHPIKVSKAMMSMVVEKYPEIVFASCSRRGFLLKESSSKFTMEVSMEFETSFVAL